MAEADDDKAPPPSDFAVVRRWHGLVGHAHASVLRWHHTVGYARHGGVSVDMLEPCAMPGHDIEYLPGRYLIDGRPMSEAERDGIARLLVQMCTDARDALAGSSTLAVVGDVR